MLSIQPNCSTVIAGSKLEDKLGQPKQRQRECCNRRILAVLLGALVFFSSSSTALAQPSNSMGLAQTTPQFAVAKNPLACMEMIKEGQMLEINIANIWERIQDRQENWIPKLYDGIDRLKDSPGENVLIGLLMGSFERNVEDHQEMNALKDDLALIKGQATEVCTPENS